MNSKQFGHWFRMYDEVVEDHKIQTLGDQLGFFWLNCMCLCSKAGGRLPSDQEIAWKLRKPVATITKWVQLLEERGLLDRDGDFLQPHNWNERQFKNDVSTERVRKYRNERKQFQKQDETVSKRLHETAPEQIQSRADTEQNLQPKSGGGIGASVSANENGKMHPQPPAGISLQQAAERMLKVHPTRSSQPMVERALLDAVSRGNEAKTIEASHAAWCAADDWRGDQKKFCPSLQRWITEDGYTKRPAKPAASKELYL